MDEHRNFYLTPLRPIIKSKAQPPNYMVKGYDTFNFEGQEMNRDVRRLSVVLWNSEDNILFGKRNGFAWKQVKK
jgi:hypothetical protein